MRALALVLALSACATRAPVASRPEPRPERRAADPAELQRLYDAAIDAYAKDRRGEAETLFKRMLDLDPSDPRAQKGLRRLSLEPRP